MRIKWRTKPAQPAVTPDEDYLSVVRDENKALQDFARGHSSALPRGMMRLLANLDYAIERGSRLQDDKLPDWLRERLGI